VTPNHFEIVQSIAKEFHYLLQENTYAAICELMQRLGTALADKDTNWGYLSKMPSEKHITLPDGRLVAVDCFIYKTTNQVVDVLGNAMDKGRATTTWTFQPKREYNNWTEIKPFGAEIMDPRVDALVASVTALAEELKVLKANINSHFAIVSANGKYLCAEGGGPEKDHQDFHFTARSKAGDWEQFRFKFPPYNE